LALDRIAERTIKYIDTQQNLIGPALRRSTAAVFRHFQSIMSTVDIAPGQFSILLMIRDQPGLTQSALARNARIERSTIGPIIRHLNAIGYIERLENASDGRAFSIRITSRGRSVVKRISPVIEYFESELDKLFSAEQRETLLECLNALEAYADSRPVA
jgi:DNA-binding MarR family transcriptional regulator|tara:strand:- start:703 stop:1179 length:477 start_codon:yes stop_codon:yes gene_type:complete